MVHQDDFRSLKKEDDVYEIGLKRALEIFAEEKKRRRGSKVLKEFKPHPKTKKKIALLEGMYGPYIKYGSKNVRLPKELEDPKALSQEKVVEIIEQNQK